MTIWRPRTPIQQLGLTTTIFQLGNEHIEGTQIDIISSLRIFMFEKNETPHQFLTASIVLDEEEEKENIVAVRPVLPPPAWQ